MHRPTPFDKMRANRRARVKPSISRAEREAHRDHLVLLGLTPEDAENVAWGIKTLDEVELDCIAPSALDALLQEIQKPKRRPRLFGWLRR